MHCMAEIITIRPKRSKAEIERAANGNVNAWINQLIENALGPKELDWDAHFKKKRCRISVAEIVKERRKER
jgi:predicted metal-dependent peptidase